MEKIVIVHDIRSIQNTASIFRTAAAGNVNKIYLTGFTPAPIDRFGRKDRRFAKISLGAEEMLPWQKTNLLTLFKKLKKEKFLIIALEQAKNSRDYKKVKAAKKTAIIVGNEVKGLSKNILKKCDVIAEIHLPGKKESLNVNVAFAVASFRIFDI